MTTTAEKFWTVPNILSLYRIIIFPFILWLIFSNKESLFAAFITVSLITDFLDGLIARAFKMQTKIGAKLDSWADLGTYLLAFIAIGLFKWKEIEPHSLILYVFGAIMVLSYVVVFMKFKGLIGLHTYMFKTTGYFAGGFYRQLVFVGILFASLLCLSHLGNTGLHRRDHYHSDFKRTQIKRQRTVLDFKK